MDVKRSIDSIFELTTRVDERVQGIMKQQNTLEAQIDRQTDIVNGIKERVKVLESHLIDTIQDHRETSENKENTHNLDLRVSAVEKSAINQEQRWKSIFSFGIQLIWVILAAYLLYKLGIQSPAVP